MVREWQIVSIGELLDFKNGLNKEKSFFGYGTPIVNYTDVYHHNGLYREQIKGKVCLTKDEIHRFEVRKGDVFFTRTSETPDEVGLSSVLLDDVEDCVFSGFVLRGRPKTDRLIPEYCQYCFSSKKVREEIIKNCTYTTRALTNGRVLSGISIPIPEICEQKAISETIACVEAYIANLTELIEKKKAIRDGALEDLVSGHTRLEGFTGKWVPYQFQEYFRLLKNNTLPREKLSDSGRIGNIHYGDILIKYGDIVHQSSGVPRIKEGVSCPATTFLQKNDVLIADAAEDETVGKVVQIGNFDIPLVAGLHTIPCRPLKKTADGYLGFYMNSTAYHNQLLPYITGIKVSSVSRKSLKETVICVPEDVEEQCAIVEILTTMDDEIASLEAERDKMQQIKSGMMDDLLTGRVRLIG